MNKHCISFFKSMILFYCNSQSNCSNSNRDNLACVHVSSRSSVVHWGGIMKCNCGCVSQCMSTPAVLVFGSQIDNCMSRDLYVLVSVRFITLYSCSFVSLFVIFNRFSRTSILRTSATGIPTLSTKPNELQSPKFVTSRKSDGVVCKKSNNNNNNNLDNNSGNSYCGNRFLSQ